MSPRREIAVVVGLAVLVLGCLVQWSLPGSVSKSVSAGPPSVTLLLRPAVKGVDKESPGVRTGLTVIPVGEDRGVDDIAVTLAFTVKAQGHRPRSSLPPSTTVRAEMTFDPPRSFTPDPAEPFVAAKQRKVFEGQITDYQVIGAMADEVERRTGLPPYAKAVRSLGEAVEVEPPTRWWGWLIAGVGALLTILSVGRRTPK